MNLSAASVLDASQPVAALQDVLVTASFHTGRRVAFQDRSRDAALQLGALESIVVSALHFHLDDELRRFLSA